MNAAHNLDDDINEELAQFDENAAIKTALAHHIEQLALRKSMGLRPPKWKSDKAFTVTIKGTPAIDPGKVAAVELPEDYGKWA